jgi:hypothetical protein
MCSGIVVTSLGLSLAVSFGVKEEPGKGRPARALDDVRPKPQQALDAAQPPRHATARQESARASPRSSALLVAHHHGDHVAPHVLVEPGPRSTAAQATEGEPLSCAAAGLMALGNRAVRSSAARAAAAILGPERVHRPPPWKERIMVTCPRCGNPAILMASEEFQLLDCEFCDDVIDVSDQELPELEPEPV